MTLQRTLAATLLGLTVAWPAWSAQDDSAGLSALQHYVREVNVGRASFKQSVTSPDGKKTRVSEGVFEFARPGQFRFDYAKPYAQTIVGNGKKVWLHDPDLNQVTVRGFDAAVGATPAAVLAGATLERDFKLSALPPVGGLDWVLASPKANEPSFRELRIGFRGQALAAIEILDAFGQRSRLDFGSLETGKVDAARFEFTPPPGADVIEQ